MNTELITNFTRNCPKCGAEIFYKTAWHKKDAIKNNRRCCGCKYEDRKHKYDGIKFIRNCPECNKQITYKSVYRYNTANEEKCKCKSCNNKGNNNPFYGKYHTNKTKDKLSLLQIGVPNTKEHNNKIKAWANTHDNPMKGKSVYEMWVKNHGKKEADRRMSELKRNHSKRFSGSGNPMYGRPSPMGTGQGWKGWYKTHYFRSLRELSYMIYLDENNITWESGESKRFTVEYTDYKGTKRTYRPDFFVDNKIIIEIKPQRLHNSPSVLAKKKSIESFCNKNGFTYELKDQLIEPDKIKLGHENKTIKFSDGYDVKFFNYIKS